MKYQESRFDFPGFESKASSGGGGQLPPPPPVKGPKKQQGYPGYVKQIGTANTTAYSREDRQTANRDLLQARTQSTTPATIRELAATTPDFSAAMAAYLRVALTQGYTLLVYNRDNTFNEDACNVGYELLGRMETMPDYKQGFSQTDSLRSCSEALAKQTMTNGAHSFELVLDSQRLPTKFAPIPVTTLKFYPDGDGLKPVQLVGGEEIDLDYPTFFYNALDQDLLTPYASSPLEPAIQPVLADAEFTQDLRRTLKRSFLPRLIAKLDHAKVKAQMPVDFQGDADLEAKYFNDVRNEVESEINSLDPEDALVVYDALDVEYLQGKQTEAPETIKAVQALLDKKVASGSKTLPSVLGQGAGTQNIASSETLLFVKAADGTIRVKLNESYSRALTLALRLLGHDVYAIFEYNPIELRPDSELEAFKAMRQARILELLSLDMMSYGEAVVRLTGRPPRKGAKPLAGTGFHAGGAQANGKNPYSGSDSGSTNGGGAATSSRQPKTPTNSKS